MIVSDNHKKHSKISVKSRSDSQAHFNENIAGLAQLMLPALIEQPMESTQKMNSNRRNRRNLLTLANSSIRKGAAGVLDIAERAQLAGRRKVAEINERPPLWLIILNRAYHKYGLKHLVLIIVFVIYCVFGGLIFWILEQPYQSSVQQVWAQKIEYNRTARINNIMRSIFNNSDYLIYIKGNTSRRIVQHLSNELALYEKQLGVKWNQQKMDWDFWNAILYAGTICTTIGYGHIYPMTKTGRVVTMIFALFGIPLMLLVLQDFGKLLTISMKFPWFQTKRLMRRIFRCCTKQPIHEMREIEAQERRDLDIFDLPLPVGISLIVIWIFICSMVLSFWDHNWTLLESFYFFFTSLSTVGLGDLVPSSPRLLITMFGFILVGLSLVSMVINLLQMKMRKTYEAGQVEKNVSMSIEKYYEATSDVEESRKHDLSLSRSTQTTLSLPSVKQVVLRSDGVHWVNDNHIKSPDEVTHLVANESGLLVCEQIGDSFGECSETDCLSYENDALLEESESLENVHTDQ